MRIHGMTRPVAILLAGVWLVSGCTNPNDPVVSTDETETPVDGTGTPALRISVQEEDVEVGGMVSFETLYNPGNTESTETITIHNDGDGTLVFSEISLLSYGEIPGPHQDHKQDVTLDNDPDEGVFYWISLPSTAPLAPGTSRDVTVQINYKTDTDYRDGLITIESNDGTNPSREVLLYVQMQEVGPP